MSSAGVKSFFGKAEAVTSGELVPTEDVLCPLCGIAPSPFAVDYQGFRLCRCGGCGLEFVSPRLSFEQLSENVYSDNYFPKRDRLPPDLESVFTHQLDNMVEITGGPKRLLDIGCGNGAFLELARETGWTIAGIDIKLAPDAHKLGCALWEGRLEEIDLAGERFDVVRLNHVLEHTQDPVKELEICRGFLADGGILFVSVPNISGLSPRLKNLQSRLHLKSNRWRHYAAMHHLFFFSPETLKAVAERAGFRVIKMETPVVKKEGQNALTESFYKLVMERTGMASIVDVYCTVSDEPPANNR
jgi:2-polyprenyl-3-methyl-5-hydroxy-6-metoxy-1,4-benzoquinol methylase